MKRKLRLMAAAFPLLTLLAYLPSTQAMMEKKGRERETIIPAEEMEFHSLLPGISQKVLSGNPDQGPYLAITKFSPGHRNALHIHNSDIKIVVLKGTFVYQSDNQERRIGPGSYLLIPAGKKHLSGAGEEEELVFAQQSEKRFDLLFISTDGAR